MGYTLPAWCDSVSIYYSLTGATLYCQCLSTVVLHVSHLILIMVQTDLSGMLFFVCIT